MAIQHPEQFHQGERRLGFTVFITRKVINAAAENFSSFSLVQFKLFAHAGNEIRIDNGGVGLFGKRAHFAYDTLRLDAI